MLWWATLLVSSLVLAYEFGRRYSRGITRSEEWSGNIYSSNPSGEADRLAFLVRGALRSPYKYEELRRMLADVFFTTLSSKRQITEKQLQHLRNEPEELMGFTNDRRLAEFLAGRQTYPGLSVSPRGTGARTQEQIAKLSYLNETLSKIRRWVE